MLEWLAGLNAELIAGGIVGLSMVGVIVRNALMGWAEARTKLKETEKSLTPLTAAMGMSWDRDQIERAIQALERIAEAHESVAESQGILSDNFQQSTQSKLDELLEKLEHVQINRKR